MGPFVVTLPSIVSSLWFPPGQRTVATGLSWLLLETGNALGFILGPLVVRDPPPPAANCTANCSSPDPEVVATIKVQVLQFMLLHVVLAGLLFLLVLVYYPSRPGDLPSFTAGEKREDFLAGMRSFLTNPSAVLVCVAFSLSQGVAEAYYPVLDLNFAPIGVPETTAGYIGFIASVVASLTCFAFSFSISFFKLRISCLFLLSSLSFFSISLSSFWRSSLEDFCLRPVSLSFSLWSV